MAQFRSWTEHYLFENHFPKVHLLRPHLDRIHHHLGRGEFACRTGLDEHLLTDFKDAVDMLSGAGGGVRTRGFWAHAFQIMSFVP
jgi:hypothetical protein